MNPIRPQLPPAAAPSRPAGDARAAFFQTVKAAAATPAAQPASPRVPAPAAAASAKPEPSAAQPARHLRPGSLVDIKV